MNKNLSIGILFIVIAVLFGVPAIQYNVGTFDNPGPGLFPIVTAILLGIIGIIAIIDSKLEGSELVHIEFKNIAIITIALIAFALTTQYINMSVGIVFLVTISSLSAATYSLIRVTKISVGLIIVASAFKYLLGLNIPLF